MGKGKCSGVLRRMLLSQVKCLQKIGPKFHFWNKEDSWQKRHKVDQSWSWKGEGDVIIYLFGQTFVWGIFIQKFDC